MPHIQFNQKIFSTGGGTDGVLQIAFRGQRQLELRQLEVERERVGA